MEKQKKRVRKLLTLMLALAMIFQSSLVAMPEGVTEVPAETGQDVSAQDMTAQAETPPPAAPAAAESQTQPAQTQTQAIQETEPVPAETQPPAVPAADPSSSAGTDTTASDTVPSQAAASETQPADSTAGAGEAVQEESGETAVQTQETAVQPQTAASPETSAAALETDPAEDAAVTETDPAEAESGLQTETETESETESKSETEITRPAQSFAGTSSNGVYVCASVPAGVFPEGTQMSVTAVSGSTAISIAKQASDEPENVSDAIGVDISFYKDGNRIEPEDGGLVSVRMSLSESLEGDAFSVVHKEDSGSVSEIASAFVSDTHAAFSSGSFSIYVIKGESDPAIAAYYFHDADGNVISTQKVKDEESVYVPTAPEKKGSKFLGWSYTQGTSVLQEGDPGDIKFAFNPDVSASVEVHLYPVFQQAYYVFFLDSQGRVSTTKEGVSGDEISVSDVTIPLDSTHSVTGWYTDKDFTEQAASVTLSDHNVTLYPKVEEGHYLYFASGEGASYVKPAFVAAGKGTEAPDHPTRPGYTFRYWSEEENGTEYLFGSEIPEDTTLFAVWTAEKNTKYTVIYWWENANDPNYSYHENRGMTGMTGSKISLDSLYLTYDGFTLNSDTTSQVNEGAVIAGDGSTLVNIYYKRKSYSIKFYKSEEWYGYSGLSYVWSEMPALLIEAKYGANISDQWPVSTSKIWGTKKGDYGQGTAPYQSGISTMPLDGGEFYYVGKSGRYTMNLNYLVEGPDGTYQLHHTDSFKTNNPDGWKTTAEDHYDIEGFTYTEKIKDGTYFKKTGSSVYEVSFKYRRNSYSIKFVNGSNHTDQTFKYGADISGVDLKTAPEPPEGIPSGYNFAGWFDNELGVGDPVALPKTMPAHNLTLYAKWTAPTHKGTIHTNIEGTGNQLIITVDYGKTINENDMPAVYDADNQLIQAGEGEATVEVPKGYSWVGWAAKNGDDFIIFNFNTKLYSDITLYPYYYGEIQGYV